MIRGAGKIQSNLSIIDIVTYDYRTADVFRKYAIDYSCANKWTLDTACMIKGLDIAVIKNELEEATLNVRLSNKLHFEDWEIDFLTDYIINIHHQYMKQSMPELKNLLNDFVEEDLIKYPYLAELEKTFLQLYNEVFPHMKQEEEVLFPYIKQLYHAYSSRESYANLLVRTLRKPVKEVMEKEHESAIRHLHKMRLLTNDYLLPEKPCVSYRVIYMKLKELDTDLVQHIHLENDILFPKAIAMEKEVLNTWSF
jgi:regulator of cell morphogenesis and NO signaling